MDNETDVLGETIDLIGTQADDLIDVAHAALEQAKNDLDYVECIAQAARLDSLYRVRIAILDQRP